MNTAAVDDDDDEDDDNDANLVVAGVVRLVDRALKGAPVPVATATTLDIEMDAALIYIRHECG